MTVGDKRPVSHWTILCEAAAQYTAAPACFAKAGASHWGAADIRYGVTFDRRSEAQDQGRMHASPWAAGWIAVNIQAPHCIPTGDFLGFLGTMKACASMLEQ